jgi:hypothetical protein
VIDPTQFADVYSLTTGRKQRVPRAWLDDPILGRDFRKTPSQRELDGELPPRPAGDAKAEEIAAFAEAADLDLSGIRKNADKLVAIEEAMGPAPAQEHVVEAEPEPPAADPLAPERVAQVDAPTTPLTSDGIEPSDETPAAGDEE